MKNTLMAVTFSLFSSLALAHGDAPAKHQGVVAEAASGNLAELSVAGNMLMLYLSDHQGQAINSAGAVAEVTLLSASAKQVLALLPAGDNALMAKEAYSAPAGSKALVKVTLPGQAAEQFRFVLK
jgi:uncharacterized protein YdbL (DUF1318 family)